MITTKKQGTTKTQRLRAERLLAFASLIEKGHARESIRAILGISRATYYLRKAEYEGLRPVKPTP